MDDTGYYSDFAGETYESASDSVCAVVEAKVSSDGGETWARRDINLGGDIEDSNLRVGEMFQLNRETYKVISSDFGLTIAPLNKLSERKRMPNKR